MSGISRYILRQLSVGMVLVTIALLCVLWLTQSLRFIELMFNKGASLASFVVLTLLLLPNFLTVILPIALFAVVLFTYNKLTADRELVVMRAAGLSHWALARPALMLGGGLAVLALALNLYFIPKSVQGFRELQWTIRNNISALALQEGEFTELTSGMTVYVRARSSDGELLGLMVHDKRNPEKPVTMMAERGAMIDTDRGPRVLMINGNRQEVRIGTGRLSLLYFDNYALDLANAGGPTDRRFRDARERSVWELINAHKLGLSENDYRRFKTELHQRFVTPLYSLSYALIALAALLSGSFNRRGQTGRILAAVAGMVLVQAAALGAQNLAISSLSFIPLIYLNALIPLAVAAWVVQGAGRLGRPAPRVGAGAAG